MATHFHQGSAPDKKRRGWRALAGGCLALGLALSSTAVFAQPVPGVPPLTPRPAFRTSKPLLPPVAPGPVTSTPAGFSGGAPFTPPGIGGPPPFGGLPGGGPIGVPAPFGGSSPPPVPVSPADFITDLARPAGRTFTPVPIDPRTTIDELLPPPPQSLWSRPVHLLPNRFEDVTEIAFQEPVAPAKDKALAHTRLIAAKILHLHNKRHDSYMEELIGRRPDLQGLPFAMGGACRSAPERMIQFSGVLNILRGSMPAEFNQPLTAVSLSRRATNAAASNQFWQNFDAGLNAQSADLERTGKSKAVFHEAELAALMQVCGPEAGAMRRGLTKHITGIPHAASSRALAKLAIFSPEKNVRSEAIEALKIRKDKDYSDILADGLRYPWPEVAKRSADAIVALDLKDLTPALIDALDEPDPRLPREVVKDGKKKNVVREMVRVNHHRNCFLCHAPSQGEAGEILTGAVPIPGEPLPSFQDGYRNSTPELAVRIDVTYLRQDFSVFMKVDGASPWPEMQRFDFLVRNREVTPAEVAALKKISDATEEGVLTPYQRAAVQALRELTGRDAAPSADAWRRILKLPHRDS